MTWVNNSWTIFDVHRRAHASVERAVLGMDVGVLGRVAGGGDQPMVLRLFDERGKEELGRSLQRGIDRTEIGLVMAVCVVLP